MQLVKPSYEIIGMYGDNGFIESCGRTCYKSEDRITEDSAAAFVRMIVERGHESVLEHSSMSVRFVVDRGVSHELVRHRLCSFSQESTRYCNYKDGVAFIIPPWFNTATGNYTVVNSELAADGQQWMASMLAAESAYLTLLDGGWTPQQARSVLPNSLKTEIVMTANFREWRLIFDQRCSSGAHPQMREVMQPLLEECRQLLTEIF